MKTVNAMFRVGNVGFKTLFGPLRYLVRTYAQQKGEKTDPTPVDVDQMTPEERQAAGAQLAIQSIKDMGSMFLSETPEDETQPINTEPIWENPKMFATLSLLHQGQVIQELQDKFDKKWTKLTLKDKQLGYYIAYGDWGSREKFINWQTSEPPYDLPFTTPSKLQTTEPNKKTLIHQLPPVILAETEVRKPQFNTRRIDGPTKFFIYVTIFISMIAFYRDKNIGEEGIPTEQLIVDPYEAQREKERIEEEQKKMEEELKQAAKKNKKWYYLWLA